MNDLFLRACRSEPVDRVPVWMMRQAGRYLPEYRRVRERADFLTMCRTPELAVEVTMQPVDLVGVDAAIIFSDILVVPQAMGMGLSVDEGVGPVFHAPLRHEADLDTLRPVVPEEGLAYMLDALRLARRELDGRVPLIGFAGAPWTLAAYMVEGKGTKQWTKAKRLLVERPDVAHRLLGMLADAVGDFLVAQVEAGAQAVQVFDSWAAALGERDFAEFALPYLARVIDRVRPTGVPVIAFAPGAGWALERIVEVARPTVLGIDWTLAPATAHARTAGLGVARQGNFDPCWLYAPPEEIRRRAHAMCDAFGGTGHVANLGHGILPDVPPAHAIAFVEAVQEWRPR
ncbi:MAG: uroporphyrinogen decarboxylase [Gemmatimonadales bacterium]|nr:uroporphyrinogen decarboxylase [Gemmatimonadota bacterium]MCA9768441.1 uroporphyrinogen decarboxylase [Gemmatimonadota bacterium]HPF60535.1 uroporphyrinogen decarboxylase [Gemmatimonadales bacterium]HRX18953.1 uroporphyrinogen decarboxylase [Gemmatimonadales bacterium]